MITHPYYNLLKLRFWIDFGLLLPHEEDFIFEMSISKSQARMLVGSIAKSHGHLDEAVYSEMSTSARRQVEEALLMKDKLIGSTVITYASDI